MSMPTKAFRDLKLGGMPETRSQTKLGQLRGGRTPTSRIRGRSRPQARRNVKISDTPVPERSGLWDSKTTAPLHSTKGLISELCVDRLQRHEFPVAPITLFNSRGPSAYESLAPKVVSP